MAAMPPAEGETVGDLFFREPPHEKAPHLEPDAHGLLWMSEEGMKNAVGSPSHTGAKRNRDSSATPDSDEVPWRSDTDAGMEDDSRRGICWLKTIVCSARRHNVSWPSAMGAQVRSHDVDHAPQISSPATVVEFVLEAAARRSKQ